MTDSSNAAAAQQRRADCERIAGSAGQLLRSRFGDPGRVQGKGDPDGSTRVHDVVTEVDFLSEQLVRSLIAEISPDAVVLAEEAGLTDVHGAPLSAAIDAAAADELWLVDPLDGTINFAHGIPHFCVSIACWRRGAPLAGAILDPMVGEVFSFEQPADAPATAWHDGELVQLGAGSAPADSMVCVGGSGRRLAPLLREFRSWRRLGSAALALAWTGVGRSGAYIQPGMLHPWDWAVGAPFVRAAGGVVAAGDLTAWTSRLTGTTGIVAASAAVHEALDAHPQRGVIGE